MAFELELSHQQVQKLVMTTQMETSLRMLTHSLEELRDELRDMSYENPCMAVIWNGRSGNSASGYRSGRDTYPDVLNAVTNKDDETLVTYVLSQLHEERLPQDQKAILEFIVGSLDERGYLVESDAELATWLEVPLQTVRKVVERIQICEPRGIGARSLEECLLLQLEAVAPEVRELVKVLITDHLDDIANHRLHKISTGLGIRLQELELALQQLRRLSPKPGAQYTSKQTIYIIPDVFIEEIDGEFVVVSNELAVPQIRVSSAYRRWLDSNEVDVADYVFNKVRAATWIARCIEQRRRTVYRVAEAILYKQREFFSNGACALKPMTLQQIADELEVHESTVSRAVRNKYMQTPHGVFEMKYFFSSSVGSREASSSAKAVKARLRELIRNEDSRQPLSDAALTDLFQTQGIEISRRTVAKYRDELRIPSSQHRRRYSE